MATARLLATRSATISIVILVVVTTTSSVAIAAATSAVIELRSCRLALADISDEVIGIDVSLARGHVEGAQE